MIACSPGDVVIIIFPFTTGVETKKRPALVLLDTNDEDIVVARITGEFCTTEFDVPITDWQQAGLKLASFVRLHKLYTLGKQRVERHLGTLTISDRQRVRTTLQQISNQL